MPELPQGAKKVVRPQGARLADDPNREGIITSTARQFVGGLEDVTELIAGPLEETFGTILIGSEGVEFVGPSEVRRRKQEGDFPRLGGGTREEPTDIFGSAARVAGQTAAAAPILGTAAAAASVPARAATKLGRAAQFPQKLIAQAGQTFARSPGAVTSVETALGASAGAGGFVAKQIFPDSDAAQFVGEIIGGTAPSLTPTGLAIRAAGGVRNAIKIVRHPFTEIGGRKRAAARAQRAAPTEQREQALTELDRPTIVDPETGKPVLTPAQRTGEQGLLSLERAVMESSEELTRHSDIRIAHANEVIQRSLTSLGDQPAAAAVPIQDAQRYLDNLLDTRVRIAAQRVDERVTELGPKASREQTNLVAREELEKALGSARAQEQELYAVIPEKTAAPFSETKSQFNTIIRSLGKAQQSDIPAVAKRFLSEESDEFFGKNLPVGFKKGETTIQELRALQSKLRETARNSRAGDKRNLNKARISDEIGRASCRERV